MNFLGTFAPFDTVNNLNGPKDFGVIAGTYTDGFSAYVGYGDKYELKNYLII